MTRQTGTYPVELGFLPDAFAIPDVEHPGLLRVGERGAAPYGGESVEHHDCPTTDCTHVDVDVDLLEAGFYIARRGFMALTLVLTDDDLADFEAAVASILDRRRAALG